MVSDEVFIDVCQYLRHNREVAVIERGRIHPLSAEPNWQRYYH